MIDVDSKPITRRTAVAEAVVNVSHRLMTLIRAGNLPKGDVLAAARIAGIQAAKRTAELIPLCHPIPLSHVEIDIEERDRPPSLVVRSEVTASWKTGVEMEALTAAAVAALTIYDMGKSIDRAAAIGPIRLVFKSGGRSGDWRAPD